MSEAQQEAAGSTGEMADDRLTVVNQWLPYAEDIKDEGDTLFSGMLEGLRALVERNGDVDDDDEESDSSGRSEKKLQSLLKDLDHLVTVSLKFTGKQLGQFLQLAYRLLVSERLHLKGEAKLLRCVSAILRSARVNAIVATGLELDVRPLYRRLVDRQLGPVEVPEALTCSAKVEASFRQLYASALYNLRLYYSRESAMALLEELMADLGSGATTYQAFQSLIILVAMLPTELPEGVYDDIMPRWLETWQLVTGCPEWDLLWIRLFCRARKYTKTFDWAAHMPMFFTVLLSTFNLPLGSSPRPAYKSFPHRLSALIQPTPFKYNRLHLLGKLVVFFLGKGGDVTVDVPLRVHTIEEIEMQAAPTGPITCSAGARELVMLLWSLRTYLNPSNSGHWHDELTAFMTSVASGLAKRVGWQRADAEYGQQAFPVLPDREVDVVVQAMLPLVHMSLYSKRAGAVMFAQQALRDLAAVRPQVVARLTLPVLVAALDPSSLTTTHQAPAALRALSMLVEQLLHPVPYLLTSLPTLLTWSLPGLDPNDIVKTFSTVAFYTSVLEWFRLRSDIPTITHEPSEWAVLIRPDDTEADAEIWERSFELAPVLTDWGLAVLERCLMLLQNKETRHVGLLPKQAMGKLDAGMSMLSRHLFRQLSTQMDEAVHKQAREKIISFCLNNTLPDAAKDTAYLLEGFARTCPSHALPHFVPALLDGLKAGAPARLLTWRIRLLAGAVRYSGDAVLPQLSRIESVLRLTLDHDEKDVRKSAGKLLRRTIQALVEIYPSEFSSHPFGKRDAFLLTPPSKDSLDASWHVPSQEELKAAAGLVQTHIVAAMEALENDDAVKSDAGALSVAAKRDLEERWRRGLKLIFNGIRGTVAVMYELPGDVSDDAAVRIGARLVLSRADADTAKFLLALRGDIAAALHRLLPLITRADGPLNRDTKALKTWLKAADEVLGTRSASCMDAAQILSQVNTLSANMTRNWVNEAYHNAAARHTARGHAPQHGRSISSVPYDASRRLLIDMVYHAHLTRASQASYRVPRLTRKADMDATAAALPYKCLFNDMIELSSYHISSVRIQAQDSVSWVAPRYPWHIRKAVPTLISTLSMTTADASANEIHERATGACHLLKQGTVLRQVQSNWLVTSQLLRAIADSWRMVASVPLDKQDNMTKRVLALLASYLNYYSPTRIYSTKWQAAYDELLAHLLALLNGETGNGALHWRYELLVMWAVLHMAQKGVEAPMSVWNVVFKGMSAGNGQPLQKLSLAGLFRLLSFALSGSAPSTPSDVKMEVSSGGSGGGDEGGVRVSAQLADALTSPSFLTCLVNALAYDHKDVEGGHDGPKLLSAGVEELIRDARASFGGSMPHTRVTTQSQNFAFRHSYLIRLLVRAVGPRVLGPLIDAVGQLIEAEKIPHEHENIWFTTAAEVCGGVISELTAAAVPEATRQKMWTVVMPLVEKTLPRLSLDYSDSWVDGLRLAATRRDPEALEPLAAMLLNNTVSALGKLPAGAPPVESLTVGDDYTSQAKCLRLIHPLLIEFVGELSTRERGYVMSSRLVNVLLSNLGHPYKACREEVARTLWIVFGNGGLALDGPATGGVDVLSHVREVVLPDADVEGLAAATAERLSVVDDSVSSGGRDGALTPVIDAKGPAQEEMTRRRETVGRWVVTSVAADDLCRTLPYALPLLPSVFECARDRDEELSKLGKAWSRLMARALWLRSRTSTPAITDATAESGHAKDTQDDVSVLLHTMVKLAGHASWYVRLEAASALAVVAAQERPVLMLSEANLLLEKLIALLADERREVQDVAMKSLSSVLSSLEVGVVQSIAEAAEKRALACVRKSKRRKDNKGQAAAADEAAEKARLRKLLPDVLLLCAVVLAYPYEVPAFLPQTVASVARMAFEPPTISSHIRKTLTDFRRTHTDEWEVRHRLMFTEEQLDALSDILVSPHYYS